MGLPLVVTLAVLLVLPGEIPVHYNAAGEVNRWGSKYEMLILPLITLLMGGFLLKVSRWSGRQHQENRTAVVAIGCGALLVFNVMTVIFLVKAYRIAALGTGMELSVSRILFGVTGLLLVCLGNVMPKLRRNGWCGVRTAWTMENDENWRRSQVVGGGVMMAAGLVLAAGNVLLSGEEASLLFSMLCVVLMIPALLIALTLLKRKMEKEKNR
ncbi:MAG: SdpI family protein [Pseudoflavonifractor sp.]|jgi:uncharacterized membrane protein